MMGKIRFKKNRSGHMIVNPPVWSSQNETVISTVRCVRLYRKQYGFGINFKYLLKATMDKGKQKYESFDDDYDEDFSGSDGDLSFGSSGTSSSSNKEDLVIDKAFLKWIAPGGSADQAGFMKGDEVISVNNSTVQGKTVTDIDELLKRSNAVDVNVVVNPSKRKYKKYVGNGYDLCVHQDSRDDSSDQESLENDNLLTSTGSDRYFFITCAKKSESSKNRSRLHQFLRPTSYCDDEPLMESKSVCMSKDNSNECNWNFQNVDDVSKGNKMIWKKSELTNPIIQNDRSAGKLTTSSNSNILVAQDNRNVWQLKVPQTCRIRSRSASPANRRVSYLMATEGLVSSNTLQLQSKVNEEDNGLTSFRVENNVFDTEKEKNNETSSFKIKREDSLEDDDEYDDECLEDFNEDVKRLSLKRKCSEDLVEIDKEGYLKRKYTATHGRRSWKRVFVILKGHILYICKEKPREMVSSGPDEKPISIKSCIVDIAYDYRKRENVFKLMTYNGLQYLFQARDRDDMMSWIRFIQRNNNPDEDTCGKTNADLIVRRKKNMDVEISSQTNTALPSSAPKTGGIKKSLSFTRGSSNRASLKSKKAMEGDGNKGTWHSKVVNKVRRIGNTTSNAIPPYQAQGCSSCTSLEECPKSKLNSALPLLVEHCCNVVESRALESVGIYRVPGNSAMVSSLEEELNSKSPEEINFEETKWNDANNMASLLRNFLRKLPEGLVTSQLYEKFINANRVEGKDRMLSLKKLTQQLPPAYGETLKFLVRHLKKVSEHSEVNKMEVRNLAIVFGPTIVRTGEDNMTTMVNDMSDRFRIVESFINNFDWFFDEKSVSAENGSTSPNCPPTEVLSPVLVSSDAMNSIEQAAVNYSESDLTWRNKGGSLKLPTFKKFLRQQSSDNSKTTGVSKKTETTQEHVMTNGKCSPVDVSPRYIGSSQPNSPTLGRRKFIKRHHSSSNIAMTEANDDVDHNKSEGEDEENTFTNRAYHSAKAYSYARPPPPSYREARNKTRGPSNLQLSYNNKEVPSENADFNSLSDETKRRLLSFTLRNKVNEKKMKQTDDVVEPIENVRKDVINKKNGSPSQGPSNASDENSVVIEPLLSPKEARKRFETNFVNNETSVCDVPSAKTLSSGAVRRRDGSTSSSSSRNFKIYAKGDLTISHCQHHQINEWMRDLAITAEGGSERGRVRAKTEDLSKILRRSSSVARSSFTEREAFVVRRRSLSCQDINVADEEIKIREKTLSQGSDSTLSSDEGDDPIEASSKEFDEKLRGLMQKLDSKSKTELLQVRQASQASSSPSSRKIKTSVEKMRALDPNSNIQSGAVSSMKYRFESGVTQQQFGKVRSSSLSSGSSASILSTDTCRRSTSTISEGDVKRKVWETGHVKSGEMKKLWKEPEWIARERAMKNLYSGSDSSIQDDNNNYVSKRKQFSTKPPYARSMSLPIKDLDYVVKGVTVETTHPSNNGVLSHTKKSRTPEQNVGANEPTHRKVSTVTSVEYKPDSHTSTRNRRASNSSESNDNPTARASSKSTVTHLSPGGYKKDHSTSGKDVEINYKKPIHIKENGGSGVQENKSEFKRKSDLSNGSTIQPTSLNENKHRQVESLNLRPVNPKSHDISHSGKRAGLNSSKRESAVSKSSVLEEHVKTSASPRRRIVSDTNHGAFPGHRPVGRTFTAPILGAKVTTTNAIELAGFAIKPEKIDRSKSRLVRRSEKQAIAGTQTQTRKPSSSASDNVAHSSLTIPEKLSSSAYGSPGIRRKTTGLTVPEIDEMKRLSTDRTLLEQNALHIKELLDEMNSEHSLKMERQKSDTISISAQKAAKKKTRLRRRSLGQERENTMGLPSRVSHASLLNERNREEASRNVTTVEWVGVSG